VGPHGYAPDEYEIEAAFAKSWEHFDNLWYKKSRTPTTAESTAVILRALRIKLPDESRRRVVTMLEEIILERPPRLVDGVAETLPLLAERYALPVVCDAAMTPGRVLRRVLALHGLEQWFDAFFFSDEHNWSKPDRRAFLTPLTALGVAPVRPSTSATSSAPTSPAPRRPVCGPSTSSASTRPTCRSPAPKPS